MKETCKLNRLFFVFALAAILSVPAANAQDRGLGRGGGGGGGHSGGGGDQSGSRGGTGNQGGGSRSGGNQGGGNQGGGNQGGGSQGGWNSSNSGIGSRDSGSTGSISIGSGTGSNQQNWRQQQSARAGHDHHAAYTTNFNHFQTRAARPAIGRAPAISMSSSTMRDLVARHDLVHIYGSNARRGYYAYSSRWVDSGFFFGAYIFDPFDSFGYVSPWYYYPCLPGYIAPERVVIIPGGGLPPYFAGSEYDWNAGYDAGYRAGVAAGQHSSRAIDYAVDDIVAMFQKQDLRALDRLVPETGNVNIYVDGKYSYSVNADDFYDLMRDNLTNTDTTDYRILDVRTQGDMVKVLAEHDYRDPWGENQAVFHTYVLKVGRRSAQITEFGTSQTRPW